MIKVSVIVPVYNVEKYLERCLNSLVNQSLQGIEIILINDGSTDSSLEIIERYYEQYPEKIVYKTIENGGAANARNVALKMARGEYIGFVDSDDYVDLTMFEKMYDRAIEQEAEIVTCGYNRISLDDVQRRDVRQRDCFGYNVYQAPQLFINNVPYIWNKIFKKSIIDENNITFENLSIFEDLVFTYELFLKANRIVRVSETLYNYIFLREDSLTYVFSEKRFDIFRAFDLLLDYFKKNRADIHFETELLFILLNHVFVVCGNDVRYRDIPLKYRFINKSFSYLDEKFSFWRSTALYFKKYKKNKFLYTKKMYWRLRNLIPTPFKHFWQQVISIKRRLNYNRMGAAYIRVCKRQNLKDYRVLINPQQGANLSGNMFYLLKYLAKSDEFKQYEIGVAYQRKKKEKFDILLQQYELNEANIKMLPINTKEYVEFFGTAKYLFSDTSFPVYFTKRKGQIYLNTWHGTPLKTLGRSTARDYYDIANLQKTFLASDYLLYPNEYMKEHMFEDYMLTDIFDNQVMMAGYPRNEIFFDEERRRELKRENGMEGLQTIAYMPTWRGNVRSVNKGQVKDITVYLNEIDERLRDDQIMYVNLHPYVANSVKYNRFLHIRPFPAQYETYDFLNACDMLVTDYSSVFFDYAITNRKIILFAYDEEEYFADRGVYITLDELPFAKVNTVEELMAEINDPKITDRTEYLKSFSPYECSNISERICKQVILKMDEGLLIENAEKSQGEPVMIHLDSLQDDASLYSFMRISEASNLKARSYYYTYNTKGLMGREKYMREFPKEMRYWGKLNPFSTATVFQSYLLYKMEKNKGYAKTFKKTVKKIWDKERRRAFVNVNFSTNIIWGREKVKEISYVASLLGRKIMYLHKAEDINVNVPAEVYEKYTYIIVENEEIAMELQKIAKRAKIVVKSIASLDELFLDEV